MVAAVIWWGLKYFIFKALRACGPPIASLVQPQHSGHQQRISIVPKANRYQITMAGDTLFSQLKIKKFNFNYQTLRELYLCYLKSGNVFIRLLKTNYPNHPILLKTREVQEMYLMDYPNNIILVKTMEVQATMLIDYKNILILLKTMEVQAKMLIDYHNNIMIVKTMEVQAKRLIDYKNILILLKTMEVQATMLIY